MLRRARVNLFEPHSSRIRETSRQPIKIRIYSSHNQMETSPMTTRCKLSSPKAVLALLALTALPLGEASAATCNDGERTPARISHAAPVRAKVVKASFE